MSEIKLLPCPFCGGELTTYAEKKGWTSATGNILKYGSMCKTVNCFVTPAIHDTKDEAIKQANTRKPMERMVIRLETVIGCELHLLRLKEKILQIVKEEGGIE